MNVRLCFRFAVFLLVAVPAGCRVSAPIHVWEPARLSSTVGKRIAVSVVSTPEGIAGSVRERLVGRDPLSSPRLRNASGRGSREPVAGSPVAGSPVAGSPVAGSPVAGTEPAGTEPAGTQPAGTELVDARSLQSASPIRLVSARDGEISDVALASVASRRGFDFMLHGQVIDASGSRPGAENRLTVSWRLTDLNGNDPPKGFPVAVEWESAVARYPDLAWLGDRESALAEAAVRETCGLIAPSVVMRQAPLAVSYVTPGSRGVRRGNAASRGGNWAEAQRIWGETIRNHPEQSAAWVNLAIAAVAEQDFASARELARQAAARHPSRIARENVVWVELMQRQYHEAFDLPDPPEGWVVSRSPEARSGRGRFAAEVGRR